ncbi:hypothetical protein [Rubrimonas cliftonensis]|uniref:Uncharacterized protein n=1 Tax=Rubrimonas cliftonensis TaxID=89524 RepID=A0A1H4DLF4_9RHOB|nr:hypothetical protein [Rubrimonas cliftonensis]SEA73358.1 hypothetical protein SAMN05444370_110101 [Rubrimonas cliftonensis]
MRASRRWGETALRLRRVAALCAALSGCAAPTPAPEAAAVATERGVVESARVVRAGRRDGWSRDVGVSIGGAVGSGGVGVGIGLGGWGGRYDRWGRRDPWGWRGGGYDGWGDPRQRYETVEYVVRLPFDRRMTIVQTDREPIPPGAAVRLLVREGAPLAIAPLG